MILPHTEKRIPDVMRYPFFAFHPQNVKHCSLFVINELETDEFFCYTGLNAKYPVVIAPAAPPTRELDRGDTGYFNIKEENFMATNRYVGSYPVIGIRPIVDGRRGPMQLRESLEPQVWAMAEAAKKLFEENLYYSNGEPVKVVMADTCIGRVPETAACADKFRREGVDITLSVTPCWCYGSETMDMDPHTIKGVWGFNGTERPGAVYLAAVLAGHAQKGLPAFGIYGHEVQDLDQITDIPEDVKEKLLRFGRAAVAVATMKGKSYLQIGSQCMGIAGSIMDQSMMEEYFGMRVESVDEVEILRRMEEGIYNEEEYQKALAWTKAHCKEGRDDNPESVQFLGEDRKIKFTDEEKEKQWEFTVKMYCIIKDLMAGNPNLPDAFVEEKVGHNAIAGGFQGQRQWTDHWPNCDYPEALLSSTFDYQGAREPYTLATENDILNGMGMLMMRLLTHRAQIFADVRTYWSGEATERVTGYKLEGKAAESDGIIHLLNSGAACLDACGECTDENGNAVMKRWWEVTEEDIEKMTSATVWPVSRSFSRLAPKVLAYRMLEPAWAYCRWMAVTASGCSRHTSSGF